MPFARLKAPNIEELNGLINTYKFIELIAIGDTGAVYKGIDEATERTVAIKIFPRRYAKDKLIFRAMRKRVKTLAKLQHQNLANILEFNSADDTPYLVMEYIEGMSLRSLCSEEGSLDPESSAKIILQVCTGMNYAHKKNVIHHDLRPQHIMLDCEGNIKIIDFELIPFSSKRDRFNQKNPLSEGFESPQLCQNFTDKKTHCSDIYSIGALLSFFSSGHTPHVLLELQSLEKSLPSEFVPLVKKATYLDGDGQYKSLNLFTKEFTKAIKQFTVHTPENSFSNAEKELNLPKISSDTSLVSFKAELNESANIDSGKEIVFNGRYKLESLIKNRRIGLLYKAWDLKINCHHALTLQMHPHSRLFSTPLDLICQDLVQLQHPNIPQTSDYGFYENGIFLVQQIIQGTSLRKVIQANPQLDFPSIRDITCQLLDALCAITHHGFYNHALSLDSIIVQEKVAGRIRIHVTDTGHAKIAQILSTVDQAMTQQRLKNPELIPPEYRFNGMQREYSTIYILGNIVYYLALGGHPYSEFSVDQVYSAHETQELPEISAYRTDIPADFSHWVKTCMEVSLENRFSSIAQATECLPPVTRIN